MIRPCPIWGEHWMCESHDEPFTVHSPRAGGTYFLTANTWPNFDHLLDDTAHKINLSRWIYETNMQGGEALIGSALIRSLKAKPLPSVPARMDALLQLIEFQTREQIGKPVSRFPEMLAATSVASEEDFSHLLNLMRQNNWISYQKGIVGYPYSMFVDRLETNIRLTPDGYQRVEILKNVQTESSQAFVAMWFDSSMDDDWKNGLKKGIEDAGYKPLRIDEKEHNNKIDEEIITEIRRSRFLVADFTFMPKNPDARIRYESRGGVYYEAGQASGRDIPVIYTCRKDMINNVHLDTRQFNHIIWSTPEELRKKLALRIVKTIGKGPIKATGHD